MNNSYNGWTNYATWRVHMEMEGKGLVLDYALAFLSDVNWQEIAKHLMEAYADEDEDEGVLEHAAWYDTSAELE